MPMVAPPPLMVQMGDGTCDPVIPATAVDPKPTGTAVRQVLCACMPSTPAQALRRSSVRFMMEVLEVWRQDTGRSGPSHHGHPYHHCVPDPFVSHGSGEASATHPL